MSLNFDSTSQANTLLKEVHSEPLVTDLLLPVPDTEQTLLKFTASRALTLPPACARKSSAGGALTII